MLVIHKSNKRGTADYGWLKTNYSFSFAEYHNPEKMGFGTLRVLNDDSIAPHTGFDTHPHSNMEIITLIKKGTLSHTDSMGHTGSISAGEIQAMSAGTGILHSEKNEGDEEVELFQLWILPKKKNTTPTYQQKKMYSSLLVSPDGRDGSLLINQEAYISIRTVDEEYFYTRFNEKNLVYALLIEGEATINETALERRDALGTDEDLHITGKGQVLIIEVPKE